MDSLREEKTDSVVRDNGEILFSGKTATGDTPLNDSEFPMDKGHENRGSLEPSDQKPENMRFSTKKKIASFLAGAALATGVFFIGDRLIDKETRDGSPTKIGATATPGETQNSIPFEAKAFVAEYGDRYNDPVSTYYANQSYKLEHGVDLVMTDQYINQYDSTSQGGATSPLGFEHYMLPKNAKIDQATSMKVFNDYTSKQLSLYMNCLAKNPDPEGVAIVDLEFANYCSAASNDNTPEFAFHQDDEVIATLMETAKSVVDKYGSAANYTVGPASNNSDSVNVSYFNENDPTDIKAQDKNGKPTEFSALTDLSILIESYDGQNYSLNEDIIKNFQLDVVIRPNPGYPSAPISIGQIANP